jgi:hypothetical protein
MKQILFVPLQSFCVSDIYLMTDDLDSRNLLQCIIQEYCARSVRLRLVG